MVALGAGSRTLAVLVLEVGVALVVHDLEITRFDNPLKRWVIDIVVGNLAGLKGPQVQGLASWKRHLQRPVRLVGDGLHVVCPPFSESLGTIVLQAPPGPTC